jgi:hypothetical protein
MKKEELLDRINNGQILVKKEHLNFKRGKLKRGSTYSYFINGEKITSVQFENVRNLISKLCGTVYTTEFIKTENPNHPTTGN